MSETKFTISVENTNDTINRLQKLLDSRSIKAKKSDLKEIISSLMGFESSNILDAKVKAHNDKQKGLSSFDRHGRHKENSDLILKSLKNPLKLFDFINKNKSITTFIDFSEDLSISNGYDLCSDDVLLATNARQALKTMLNWNQNVEISLNYYKDEEYFDPEETEEDACYWELKFIGDGDQKYLGSEGTEFITTCELCKDVNNPNVSIEEVSNIFLDYLIKNETLFQVNDRDAFMSYLKDDICDEYGENYFVATEDEFVSHVEKFLPYIGIQKISWLEVGSAPVQHLERLVEYHADFSKPELLVMAAGSGCEETCRFLLKHGNCLDNLFIKSWGGANSTKFHDQARTFGEPSVFEQTKVFYSTAKALGVDIDRIDSEGCTALHCAAECVNEEVYTHLMSLGASQNLKNGAGDTAIEIMKISKKQKEEESKTDIFSSIFSDIF